jgi:stress response protein YsnF
VTTEGTTARAESLRTGTTEGEEAIPVVEEEVRVGKREVGGGRVRVRSYVTERPVEEQVQLREERVQVERRPVDRELSPGEASFQEKEIEAVERGEEAVVDKKARVTEEVGVRKDVDTRTETVRDTARKTEVEVEDERAERDITGGKAGTSRRPGAK